jgi:2-polyprenyl-6-hydroxyphenyl methylase/3-demethylubiquinone-9 3-methyltransferase
MSTMRQPARPAGEPKGQLTEVEYWDRHWSGPRRDERYATLGWVQQSYQYVALDRLLKSVLPRDPSLSFMELGSGPARWMIYFAKTFGYRVTGCDTSALSCDLARRNLAAAGVSGTIEQQDFFTLQGTYDVVFSGGVVEHFEDPSVPVAAFARLVRPGGFLVTDVPNLTGLNGFYRRALKPETFETHRPIGLRELRHWHRELGLREVLATAYGSLSLGRVPADALRGWPRLQRLVWRPTYRLASGGLNRACLLLHRLHVRVDHPLISPHLIVVARKEAA